MLDYITPVEKMGRMRPCIADICMFECIAYAIVPDEKRGRLDAKGTKYLFLD